MEKTKGFLGVNKRVKKKSYKKRLLSKVVDYLKSDYYMFAPLVSSPPSDISVTNKISASSCTGVHKEAFMKPSEGKNTNLLNKVEEYLKTDLYMYAPMVGPQLSKADLPPPLNGATTSSISPVEILKKNEQISKSTEDVAFNKGEVVRQTIALRETVKHVHHNCRSSAVPGKKALEKRRRKLVE